MGVREDIMAIPVSKVEGFTVHIATNDQVRRMAADIAEARERELLAELADIKECHNNLLQSDKSVIQQMIAEFRELSRGFIGWDEKFYEQDCGDYIETKSLEAILAKYEEMT